MSNTRSQMADGKSFDNPSKTHLRLWLKMLKISRLIESELRERLRLQFNTTLPQFDVMAALCRADAGLKMSKLSGELKVSNGNVTGIVDRLVKDDLVQRIPVEGDRRATMVRLTRKGESAFSAMAVAHEHWVSELMTSLCNDEAAQLWGMLDSVEYRLDNRKPKK